MNEDLHRRYIISCDEHEALFGTTLQRPTYEEWLEALVTVQHQALDQYDQFVKSHDLTLTTD